MKIRIIILAMFISLQLWSCDSTGSKTSVNLNQKNAPKDLNEVFQYLDNKWSFIEKLNFKRKSEDDATADTHRSTGLWIRNNWIRGNRNPPLVKFFGALGLHHPDDISSVIMLSYHRRLNHRPLDLNDQIKEYTAYWKKISDCEKGAKEAALNIYHKYKTGDEVTIRMYVDTSYGNRNATVFLCPNTAWKFDSKKDLILNGTITSKYFINSPTNVFFKIRVDQSNLKNLSVIGQELTVGKELDFSLPFLDVR